MKKLQILFILFLSFFSCKEEEIVQNNIDDAIKRVAKANLISGRMPGMAIGVITKDGDHKFYSFGTQNLSTAEIIDEYTIFEIGSITKTFVGLLYADMVINKKVSLNEEANRYLPLTLQIPSKDGVPVSIENLLNHTSGLPREPENLDIDQPLLYSEIQMSDYLKSASLLTEPGSTYLYSNTGMGLAGYMIKQITGVSFKQSAKEKIFRPLNMNYTFCEDSEIPASNVAQGYWGNKQVDFLQFSDVFASAGIVKSNLHDMLIYLGNAMDTNNSIYKDAFELAEKQTFSKDQDLQIALGWHLSKLENNPIVWHNGGTNGFASYIGFNKESKYGVVVLINGKCIGEENELAHEILKLLDKY